MTAVENRLDMGMYYYYNIHIISEGDFLSTWTLTNVIPNVIM